MKRIFNLSLLFAIVIVMAGCEDHDSKRKSYITNFTDPQAIVINKAGDNNVQFKFIGRMITSGAEFKMLTESYGDRNYHGSYSSTGPCRALTSGVESIKIETLSDFLPDYPACSEVTQLVDCAFASSHYYINHNYTLPDSWEKKDNYGLNPGYGAIVERLNATQINTYCSTLANPNEWLLIFNRQPEKPGAYKFILTVNIETRSLTQMFEVNFQ